MTERYTVIRVGFANRIAIYWIPVLLAYLGARKLVLNWHASFDIQHGSILIAIAIVFVLACEYFLFGFRIAYNSHELIYRFRGLPFPREKRVSRAEIRRAKYEARARVDNKPWRFVEIAVDGAESQYSLRINLTGFSTREIDALLEWFPHLERDNRR